MEGDIPNDKDVYVVYEDDESVLETFLAFKADAEGGCDQDVATTESVKRWSTTQAIEWATKFAKKFDKIYIHNTEKFQKED